MFLVIQGFFSMMEMAAVSFNRVRLQYYVSKGSKKAIWLSNLLKNPARLFGTTLIGVNTALQFGSECSRRFYSALDLSPDWAPLTQVILVCIFAELAPMFAARRYAEHVIMIGIRLLYFCSIVMRPFIWLFDLLTRALHFILRIKNQAGGVITREEIQKAIEAREDKFGHLKEDEFDTLVTNIFKLKSRSPREIMQPLKSIVMLSDTSKVSDLKEVMRKSDVMYCPIYHDEPSNIIGIVYARDLLRLADSAALKPYIRSPWYISDATSIYDILKQFRRHNENHAIVLNSKGWSTGILTLDDLIDEILYETAEKYKTEDTPDNIVVNCSYPSDTLVTDIEDKLGINLPLETEQKSLEEIMTIVLGHRPSLGETIRVGHFELTVKKAPFMGAKQIRIRTVL